MNFEIAGKTAVVTAGSLGIGKATALSLAKEGANVAICGRDKGNLEAAVKDIQSQVDVNIFTSVVDVSDASQIHSFISEVRGEFGAISILVNNAGISQLGTIDSATSEEYLRVMDTNMHSVFYGTKRAVAMMRETGNGGNIINIASVLGLSVQKGTGAYTASKAGLIQLTRQMAIEWAKYGVRVNALLPGYYLTDIASDYLESDAGAALVRKIPQRRLGDVSDLHGPILLLASDASRYMTGSSLCVDGGLSIPSI